MPPKKPLGAWFENQRKLKESNNRALSKTSNKWLQINETQSVASPSNVELETTLIPFDQNDKILKENASKALVLSISNSDDQCCTSELNTCEKQTNISNFDFNNPAKWPTLTSNLKTILVEHGPPKILDTIYYPLDENNRHFSKKWFYKKLTNGEQVQRQWLMYSVSNNKLFCFPCVLFSSQDCAFVSGFNDWPHLNPRLPDHENNLQHKQNYIKWKEFEKIILDNKTIDCEVQQIFKNEKGKWRNILKIIVDVIMFCSRTNLPLRGHLENLTNSKKGIFLDLIEVISHYDTILK